MDDESKAAWRRQFMPMLHPYLPQMATLIETAGKLEGVLSFIDSLSPDVESQRDDGIFVGSLAIRYGLKILDHFGFVDGEDAPMPTHLDQVRIALANVVGMIRDDIHYVRMEVRKLEETEEDPGHDDVGGIDDAARRDADDDGSPSLTQPIAESITPVIDRATFTVKCGEKSCYLGNTKAFQLLERLSRGRETFVNISTLARDVWPDSAIENGTIHKTISNLRKKLATAGLTEHFTITAQPDHYSLVIR